MVRLPETMGYELFALAGTIKVLNDDDALNLFKKTLPGAANSLLQVMATTSPTMLEALTVLHSSRKGADPRVDFQRCLRVKQSAR